MNPGNIKNIYNSKWTIGVDPSELQIQGREQISFWATE